ncbi:MAG: diguanylate cyclase domain-containing protein, partial [Angustibacter sp.]
DSRELLLIADEATALTEGQAKILDILATLTGFALGLSMRGAELNVEQDRRKTAAELTGIGHWRWEPTTNEMHWSPEMFAMMGLSEGLSPSWELWESRLHPESRSDRTLAATVAAATQPHTIEYQIRHTSGNHRDVLMWWRPVFDDGVLRTVVGAVLDRTAQRSAEAAVARMAACDSLTGLANRQVLEELTQQAIAALPELAEPDEVFGLADLGVKLSVDRRDDEVLSLTPMTALLLIDLDRFKLVNDSLGHARGDELLVALAERLRASLQVAPINDCAPTVARVGGDEFVVLLPWIATAEAAEDVAHMLLEQIRRPFALPGLGPIVCTGSIGVAATSNPRFTPGDLLREADLALYRAKDAGRDRTTLFDVQLKA